MIDEPRTETASASAAGSSGTVIVASGRVCSDRAPTVTVVGRSNSTSTAPPSIMPVVEAATSGARISALLTPATSKQYDPRGSSIGSLSCATNSPSTPRTLTDE